MHQIEGHHFASPFAPNLPVGGKQRIETRDPLEIVFGTGKGPIPLREKGGEGDRTW